MSKAMNRVVVFAATLQLATCVKGSVITVYWTDAGDSIQRATLDGSNGVGFVGGLGNPQDVAVDLVNGKIYWTDDLRDKIQRASLLGGSVEDLVTGVKGPKGIALDLIGEKTYWADNYTDRILRADLNGSNQQVVWVYPNRREVHTLGGVALDLTAGKVYWADTPTGRAGKINRRNMDGTEVWETVISSNDHGPGWIDIDTQTGDVFWSSRQTGTILRNNDVITSGIDNVRGIAIDVEGRQLYWTAWSDDKIQRANLDGSGQEDVLTGLSNPLGITLAYSESVAPATLQPGDANQDLSFDQYDVLQVLFPRPKYRSGQPATWGEGDWDGAPGGSLGDPPPGDGVFNHRDIVAALAPGHYLTGPYAALQPNGQADDGQTSIVYDATTGEVAIDAPADIELTSINVDSASAIFTGDAAMNLGGSFDIDADENVFKATFGSSFGSLSFGNVAPSGLSEQFMLNDLTVNGSLAGGGDLGDVDLVYVSEPSAVLLASIGLLGIVAYGWPIPKSLSRTSPSRMMS